MICSYIFLAIGCTKNASKVEHEEEAGEKALFIVQWKIEANPESGMPLTHGFEEDKHVTYYINGKAVGAGYDGVQKILTKIEKNSQFWFFYDNPIASKTGVRWLNKPNLFTVHWDEIKKASNNAQASILVGDSIENNDVIFQIKKE